MPKLYLDSRARKDGSPADFTIELPRPINLDTPHLCSFDSVAIPNVFKPIDATNSRIYVYENAIQIPTYNQVETWRVALIEQGHYSIVTLAAAVQTALNAQTTLADSYTVAYGATRNRLTISNPLSNGGAFGILGRRLSEKGHRFLEREQSSAGHD